MVMGRRELLKEVLLDDLPTARRNHGAENARAVDMAHHRVAARAACV